MKQLISILSLAALMVLPAMSQSASAELSYPTGVPVTLIAGATNNLAVVLTNTVNLPISATTADTIAIYISARPILSNSVTMSLVINKSVAATATGYDSVSPITIEFTGTTNAATGATVSLATNIQVGAFSRLRLSTIGSKETIAVVTNLTVQYGFKR